jgi:hypothetical protein
MPNQWFIDSGNQPHGPLSDSQLKRFAEAGQVTPATRVRLGMQGQWVLASSVKGLFPARTQNAVQMDDLGFDELLSSSVFKSEESDAAPVAQAKPEPAQTTLKPRELPAKEFDRLNVEKRIFWNVSFVCTILGIFGFPLGMVALVFSGLSLGSNLAEQAFQLFSVGVAVIGACLNLMIAGVALRLVCGTVDLALYVAALLEDIRQHTRQQ